MPPGTQVRVQEGSGWRRTAGISSTQAGTARQCYDVASYCVKHCATLNCDMLYLDSMSFDAPEPYIEKEGMLFKSVDGERYEA